MNERIEHCLYQAGLTAQGCWDELGTYEQAAIEKFAELIIRECCKVSDEIEPLELPWKTSRFVKLHFGIEE